MKSVRVYYLKCIVAFVCWLGPSRGVTWNVAFVSGEELAPNFQPMHLAIIFRANNRLLISSYFFFFSFFFFDFNFWFNLFDQNVVIFLPHGVIFILFLMCYVCFLVCYIYSFFQLVFSFFQLTGLRQSAVTRWNSTWWKAPWKKSQKLLTRWVKKVQNILPRWKYKKLAWPSRNSQEKSLQRCSFS